MSQQIKKFDQIIKTAREKEQEYLALQRNLVALNAAFDAARAGEAGTEFFVAVDEISNLAIQGMKARKGKDRRDR